MLLCHGRPPITIQDDMQIRAFNYNTLEKVHQFEAHTDYIRSLAAHNVQPLLLSSSDDMTIKLWNWEQNWACTHTFEAHTHYVMCVLFNPKDTNTFASASLDRTIKVCALLMHFFCDGPLSLVFLRCPGRQVLGPLCHI